MTRLRIRSNGTLPGTTIEDAETGAPIYARRVEVVIGVDEFATAELELALPPIVDLVADGPDFYGVRVTFSEEELLGEDFEQGLERRVEGMRRSARTTRSEIQRLQAEAEGGRTG